MTRAITITILLLLSNILFSQQGILVFKKGKRDIQRYWPGSTIAFQLHNKEWRKGEIITIRNDSFFIRPMVVRFGMFVSDTTYYPVTGFSITDVYAMPGKGILVDYVNGRFQISRTGGHVHWYWIKSGWIFRVGAAGYAGVHITNELIDKRFSFSGSKRQLLTAAGIFLGGVLLKKTYKPYIKTGKKYHLYISRN